MPRRAHPVAGGEANLSRNGHKNTVYQDLLGRKEVRDLLQRVAREGVSRDALASLPEDIRSNAASRQAFADLLLLSLGAPKQSSGFNTHRAVPSGEHHDSLPEVNAPRQVPDHPLDVRKIRKGANRGTQEDGRIIRRGRSSSKERNLTLAYFQDVRRVGPLFSPAQEKTLFERRDEERRGAQAILARHGCLAFVSEEDEPSLDEDTEVEPKKNDTSSALCRIRPHFEALHCGQKALKDLLLIEFGEQKRRALQADAEELGRCIAIIESCEREALERNLRLVVSVVRHFEHRGLELLDLIEEGNIALMRAIDKFEVVRGCKLSTYAVAWIRQMVSRAITAKGRTVSIPDYAYQNAPVLVRATERLTLTLGRPPNVGELAKDLGWKAGYVENIQEASQQVFASGVPVNYSTEWGVLERQVRKRSAIQERGGDPVAAALRSSDQEMIGKALLILTPREKDIVERSFGLRDQRPRTLEEISLDLHISGERVRQIKVEALVKIGERLRAIYPTEVP